MPRTRVFKKKEEKCGKTSKNNNKLVNNYVVDHFKRKSSIIEVQSGAYQNEEENDSVAFSDEIQQETSIL